MPDLRVKYYKDDKKRDPKQKPIRSEPAKLEQDDKREIDMNSKVRVEESKSEKILKTILRMLKMKKMPKMLRITRESFERN